ncbi:MAG TPA: hypothetical protein DC000_13055 [Clostridiales bacterium]|nr:hypothetical protein [Clostridiales bacterium]
MEINYQNFIEALILDTHPMRRTKSKLKMQYYIGLEHLLRKCEENNEYTSARLKQYRNVLVGNTDVPKLTEKECKDVIYSLVNSRIRPWRKKYRYWLLCDIALIIFDEAKIKRTATCLKEYLNKRQALEIENLQTFLFNNVEIPKTIMFTKDLVEQFRTNRDFAAKPEKRYIVTANVSAGKSTLINAIIGKPLTRTSQEICTGNLCYIYNKPFEDDVVHLAASPLNFNASYNDLANTERSVVSSIASHFRMTHSTNRVCIIDTPGVNSAINRNHKKITRKVLKEEIYNKLIYVLNANKLGTDEEKEHLQWVAENVTKEKVVFVLNKLDDFKNIDDSVEESINGVKSDLNAMGYENPIICPISSYFAFLIKLKENGEQMSEDEIDAYNLYFKKFSKDEYDLSIYSSTIDSNTNETEQVKMGKRCGLYGLEQVLFGGES